MSAYQTGMVWLFSKSTGSARLVLLALADNSAHDGSVTISQTRLAELCNCATETVRRAILDLIEAGEIAISRESVPTRYTILPPESRKAPIRIAAEEGSQPPRNEVCSGDTGDTTHQFEGGDVHFEDCNPTNRGDSHRIVTVADDAKVLVGITPEEAKADQELAARHTITVDDLDASRTAEPIFDGLDNAPQARAPMPRHLPESRVGYVLAAAGVQPRQDQPFYWFRMEHEADLDALCKALSMDAAAIAARLSQAKVRIPDLRRIADLVEHVRSSRAK